MAEGYLHTYSPRSGSSRPTPPRDIPSRPATRRVQTRTHNELTWISFSTVFNNSGTARRRDPLSPRNIELKVWGAEITVKGDQQQQRQGIEESEVSIHVTAILRLKRIFLTDRDLRLGSPPPVLRGEVLNTRPIVQHRVFWRLVSNKWNLHENRRFVTRKFGKMAGNRTG